MYNNFIKLTEIDNRGNQTREIFVNVDKVFAITRSPAMGSRIRFSANPSDCIDVKEVTTEVIGLINGRQSALTEIRENVGSRNEDGRVSNPAE